MYAIIRTGGKQYRVAKDDVITVERLPGDEGSEVTIDQVLMVAGDGAAKIGAPTLDGASVTAEIVAQSRADKVIIFKKRRRQKSRTKNGHRQLQSVLKITAISA
jgi:large subunit ribosomal protein L21